MLFTPVSLPLLAGEEDEREDKRLENCGKILNEILNEPEHGNAAIHTRSSLLRNHAARREESQRLDFQRRFWRHIWTRRNDLPDQRKI
jgi:hypothetical protein